MIGTPLSRIFTSLASWSERFSAEERAMFEVAARAVERELPDAAVVVVVGPDHDPTLNEIHDIANTVREMHDDLAMIEDRLTTLTRKVPHSGRHLDGES